MSAPSSPESPESAPAAWIRTQEFLRGRFRIEQDLPKELCLTFVTRLNPDRPEAQQLRCVLETQNGDPWLLARADVCREGSLDPLEALRLAARLRIGGVALFDGAYEVRRAFRLADVEHAALAEALQYLALEAAFLRTRARPLPGQPGPTEPTPADETDEVADDAVDEAADDAGPADEAPAPDEVPTPAKHWTD
ncbi:MAG: hypothetical protein U1A78_39565 [Polyangia bacterium]